MGDSMDAADTSGAAPSEALELVPTFPVTHPGTGCMSMHSLQGLNRLRQNKQLCDAIIRTTDGGVFHVHRAILSTSSSYFLTMFTTTLNSKEASDVTIHLVSGEVMGQLIEYSYLRKTVITQENVQELLVAADYLSFLSVLQLCCDFLKTNLNPTNCLGTMLFARCYFCVKLEESARHYALQNFVAVATTSSEFLLLEPDDLLAFLADEELNVRSEEAAWDAAIRWVQHDASARRKQLVPLMANIRLGLMDPQVFIEKVKNHPYVLEDETSRPVVIQTLKFMYDLETIAQRESTVSTPLLARPRVPHEVLFAIGGWSGGSPTSFVETYDTRADRWTKLEEIDPAGPRAYHGTAVLGNCIYVIGGFNGSDYFNSCRCYDALNKMWKEVAPMNARRCYVSVTVLRGDVFAMGGYDGHHRQRTVEKYCHHTNQWSMVAPMAAQRSDASACTLDDKIYITGGFNGQECMSSVEVYDPDTDQWSYITPMNSLRSGVSCVAYHDKVYVIGGFNGVSRMASGEVYTPSTGNWTLVPDMYNQRSNFAIEVIDDLIFAIGGFNGVTTTPHVECYDEKTNMWYEATDLLLFRSALSASVIMGLPNVKDYIYQFRGGLMEEKRLRLVATAQHPQPLHDNIRYEQNGVDEDDAIEDDDIQSP